jgi:hypothetical protein
MLIERSTVTKLLISDLNKSNYRLDPVTVFLEDLGQRTYEDENKQPRITKQGKITIECYGESWSAYWGGMGNRTVAQFFDNCSVDYLAGCLKRGTSLECQVFNGEMLERAVKKTIIDCRRMRPGWGQHECGSLDKEDARELWDNATDFLGTFETTEGLMHSSDAGEILTALYGNEWHYFVQSNCFSPNPHYLYLCRIIAAVQEALRVEQQAAA